MADGSFLVSRQRSLVVTLHLNNCIIIKVLVVHDDGISTLQDRIVSDKNI